VSRVSRARMGALPLPKVSWQKAVVCVGVDGHSTDSENYYSVGPFS
jgi:hypothetical protein